MLLFLHGESFTFFVDYLETVKFFGWIFLHVYTWRYTIISNLVIAGNHESFSRNKGKDMKQRKCFTTNKKAIYGILSDTHPWDDGISINVWWKILWSPKIHEIFKKFTAFEKAFYDTYAYCYACCFILGGWRTRWLSSWSHALTSSTPYNFPRGIIPLHWAVMLIGWYTGVTELRVLPTC